VSLCDLDSLASESDQQGASQSQIIDPSASTCEKNKEIVMIESSNHIFQGNDETRPDNERFYRKISEEEQRCCATESDFSH
jgi:hypothetical protein